MNAVRYGALVVALVTLAGGVVEGAACGGGVAGARADDGGAPDASVDVTHGMTAADGGGTARDGTTVTGPDSACGADTQTDPHHCGVCGHDCLGGACQAGACQPVVLATDPNRVSGFTIDATSVYWTTGSTGYDAGVGLSNGTVSKCPLSGCTGSPTTLATGQDGPESIWVSGNTLYWNNFNGASFMQCSVDCNDNATVFVKWAALGPGAGFAVNATQAFFTSAPLGGLIEECPVSGCGNPVTFASGQQTPNQIVIGGANLCWIDLGTMVESGNVVSFFDGGIMTCPVGGCDGGPTALARGLSYPLSLAVDGTTAYWIDGATQNALVKCAVGGCNNTPTKLVSNVPNVGLAGVAVDATDAYFGGIKSVSSGGPATFFWQIMKCAIAGCGNSPTLLYSTQFNYGGPLKEIAVDATRIYFVSGDNSQILTLAK